MARPIMPPRNGDSNISGNSVTTWNSIGRSRRGRCTTIYKDAPDRTRRAAQRQALAAVLFRVIVSCSTRRTKMTLSSRLLAPGITALVAIAIAVVASPLRAEEAAADPALTAAAQKAFKA